MDSESVIHDELSQYKVIEHLESIDPDEYHAFLYHLLNHFKGASVALEFLFNEILRYEPAASPLIQKLREILIILSNLGFMHSWSEFIAFSSQPPFTLHVDEQRFIDFLRREITESSLTKLRSVCSLLSIPASTAYYCFVVKTLFDSQSKPSLFPLFLSHSSLQLELRRLLQMTDIMMADSDSRIYRDMVFNQISDSAHCGLKSPLPPSGIINFAYSVERHLHLSASDIRQFSGVVFGNHRSVGKDGITDIRFGHLPANSHKIRSGEWFSAGQRDL